MLRVAVPILLALGLQGALTARTAEAHIPPPAYMKLSITDAQTEVLVALAFDDVFGVWFPFEARDIAPDGVFTPEQREAVEGVLSKCLQVRIDGLRGMGRLQDARIERFEDHMRTWTYVQVRVRYATEVPPRQVAFIWRGDAADTHVFRTMNAELEAYGELSFPKFRKEEPEHIWHRPVAAAKPAPVVLPQRIEPPHVTVPLVSAGLVLALLVLGLLRRGRYSPWHLAVGVIVVGLAAFELRHVAHLDVPLPGDRGLVRPPDAEALKIFASLHRGVYTAMEGEDEDGVYDRLAESVTGELLPRLYLEIRQSMILQEEGGAVAKIRKTEIVETAVLDEREEGAPWFKVHARWRVVGRVGHWGHTHQRVNEYLADATVVAKDGHWMIARIDVLEETRVDDGKKVR